MRQIFFGISAIATIGIVVPGVAGPIRNRALPAVQHTEPCRYPNGWNAADYSDDLAGRPKDRYHQCRVGPNGQLLDSDGQPTD